MAEYNQVFKIILVGDASVGKTHLLSRYVRNSLPKSPTGTIGIEFATHLVKLQDGASVKAQLWDTAGQEKYRSITAAHYRRAVGALLVYDVTKKASFLNAARWLEDVRQNAEPDIIVMLVGNKVDLVQTDPSSREVSFELAAQYAAKNGLLFSEASAVSTFHVTEAFETLLQEIYNQKAKTVSQHLSGKGQLNMFLSADLGIRPAGQQLVDLILPPNGPVGAKEPGCCGQS